MTEHSSPAISDALYQRALNAVEAYLLQFKDKQVDIHSLGISMIDGPQGGLTWQEALWNCDLFPDDEDQDDLHDLLLERLAEHPAVITLYSEQSEGWMLDAFLVISNLTLPGGTQVIYVEQPDLGIGDAEIVAVRANTPELDFQRSLITDFLQCRDFDESDYLDLEVATEISTCFPPSNRVLRCLWVAIVERKDDYPIHESSKVQEIRTLVWDHYISGDFERARQNVAERLDSLAGRQPDGDPELALWRIINAELNALIKNSLG